MPTVDKAATATFQIRNSTTGAAVLGDTANITARIVADGVLSSPANSIAEVGLGEYKLVITAAENSGDLMAVIGSSMTSGAIFIPARWQNMDPAQLVVTANVTMSDMAFISNDILEIIRGDKTTLTLSIVDSSGTAIDLTPYSTLKLTVKETQYREDTDDTHATLQITGSSAAPTSGVATFLITAAASEALSITTEYDYDVQGDDGAGNVRTLARGIFRSLYDVTRASGA